MGTAPLSRAWATLELKAVDDDERLIEGVASTPAADRVGDIMEPKGAQYTLPLPLLWQHKTDAPIGHVTAVQITPAGIMIKARIQKVEEPGALKDRLDEAFQSVKAGLVRGLSIGWRPIEAAIIQKTGGLHVLKWLWFELSVVTIPQNLSATITNVKSAAGGGRSSVSVVRRRADAGAGMQTIPEQITQWSNTRAPLLARLNELMAKSSDNGATLDEADTEEYEGLKVKIKSVDVHMGRLREQEQLNQGGAVPATGGSPEEAAASRTGLPSIRVKSMLPPGYEFARYAMCLLAAPGNLPQALEIAKARYPDEARIHLLLKAAVAAGTTTDPAWAGALIDYENFVGDFIEYLRPQTILGKFGMNGIPDVLHVPFNIRVIGQTSGGAAYWVGQGAPKPLTKFDFAPVTLGWAKVANIAVLSDELVRFSKPNAEKLVRDALSAAITERLDIDFINPAKAAVANVSPASITNGVTPIVSDGVDAATVAKDVKAAMAPFAAANIPPTGMVWIMSASTALSLSLMITPVSNTPAYPGLSINGGTFAGLPVIVSQYVGNIVVLVHAPDIYLADDGQVVIDASREASLEMSDAPTNNSTTGTGVALVSMFQTNSVALRAERFINWAKRRAAAVSYISDVDWGGTESVTLAAGKKEKS